MRDCNAHRDCQAQFQEFCSTERSPRAFPPFGKERYQDYSTLLHTWDSASALLANERAPRLVLLYPREHWRDCCGPLRNQREIRVLFRNEQSLHRRRPSEEEHWRDCNAAAEGLDLVLVPTGDRRALRPVSLVGCTQRPKCRWRWRFQARDSAPGGPARSLRRPGLCPGVHRQDVREQ